MASCNIFIYELVAADKTIATDIYNLLKEFPEDENNYFSLQLLTSNELSGEYVFVQTVEEKYYSAEYRTFETRVALKANIVHFDVIDNQLEIWSNKTNTNRLVFTLSNLMRDISINAVNISLTQVLHNLQYLKFKISKVCFDDFLFADDIVGSFSVDLSSYGDALSVLLEYQDKIARMTILLPYNETSLRVSLTSKGSVTVYKSREVLDDDAISILHKILIK